MEIEDAHHLAQHEQCGTPEEAPDDHRPGTRRSRTAGEGAHQEQGDDGWNRVRKHELEVLEQRVESLDLRCPDHRDQHENEGHETPDLHELLARQPGPVRTHEIHGHERRSGIERRVDLRHQRSHECGEGQSENSRRQQIEHQGRIHQVGALETRIEGDGHRARQHHDEEYRKLERSGEQAAPATVIQVLGAEDALYHELVRAPEVESEDRDADEQAEPRHARVVQRPDQAEHGRIYGLAHLAPAAELVERCRGDDHGAQDEQDGLDRVGDDDGRQPPDDRVAAGDERQNPDDLIDRYLREHHADQERPAKERRRRIDDDVEEDRQ